MTRELDLHCLTRSCIYVYYCDDLNLSRATISPINSSCEGMIHYRQSLDCFLSYKSADQSLESNLYKVALCTNSHCNLPIFRSYLVIIVTQVDLTWFHCLIKRKISNIISQKLPLISTVDRFKNKCIYVSLQLRAQNRRRKWHFPLYFRNGIIWTSPFPPNICNAINWAGVTSKAFSSSEALILYSVKMPTCMVIFNSFQSKTLYTVLIFKWSCLDTNLWIWNLCICQKNMPTEHQHLVTVLAYRKYCRRHFKYDPWTNQGNNICNTELLQPSWKWW